MTLRLCRLSTGEDSTIGALYIDGVFSAWTLEDVSQKVKVAGKTRIPEGYYQIKKRRILSTLTKKYRKLGKWFDFHLELKDVQGFKYVYLHKGNTAEHSEGCILVADSANNNQVENGFIGNSTNCFKRVYRKVSKALDDGQHVYIDIRDLESEIKAIEKDED